MEINKLSSYQKRISILLALIQFSVVMDFMVLAPLGVFVMKDLHLSPSQFSVVVSAYAIAAFVSAITSVSFADRFDRKKLLIFFFTGFIIGTVFCGLSNSYASLLAARLITGLFGGVMSSISFSIVTDLFEPQKRGRVTGMIQMGFGLSQVTGIPISLYLAEHFSWHIPFFAVVGLAIFALFAVIIWMKPVKEHLKFERSRNVFLIYKAVLSNPRYLTAFGATALMITGGFMIMPFASDFAVQNLKVEQEKLDILYAVTGLFTFSASFLAGRLSDRLGRMNLFIFGTLLSMLIVLIYTNLGVTALPIVILLNALLFIGISTRIVPAQAMMTMVPTAKERGAFMSLNAAVQQLSGGIAAFIAGKIVYKNEFNELENYPIIGIVVVCTMILTVVMMYFLHRLLKKDE